MYAIFCQMTHTQKTKKKSFQIILPSDVDIALASIRATESVLRRRREQRSLVNCLR